MTTEHIAMVLAIKDRDKEIFELKENLKNVVTTKEYLKGLESLWKAFSVATGEVAELKQAVMELTNENDAMKAWFKANGLVF